MKSRVILLSGVALLLSACSEQDAPLALLPGEELPAGVHTNTLLLGSNAFLTPMPGLSIENEAAFYTGNSFFNQAWVMAPASTTGRDGLGPLFNARSCSSCHFRDGRGRPAGPDEDVHSGLLARLSIGNDPVTGDVIPEPIYGGQFQDDSITGVPAEGRIALEYETISGTYADGTPFELQRPMPTLQQLGYGDMHPDTQVSLRVAPQMIGLGLLEAIPDARLQSFVDADDTDGDGISGRQNQIVAADGTVRGGRFGWKAEQPDVRAQSAGAFANDMGITSYVAPFDACTDAQSQCLTAMDGGTPEISDELLEKVVLYSRVLAPPIRRGAAEPDVLQGRELFNEARCASCHVPSHAIPAHPELPEIGNTTIWPYTDLLLHDMGEGLADSRPVWLASGSEWRTPPLWGIGLFEAVNGHTRLLHDGRARGVAEAILWHGGEAQSARDAFVNLSAEQRAQLVAFVESL